jgi:predicted  nucleic acid-binding Zn-ribbon protein
VVCDKPTHQVDKLRLVIEKQEAQLVTLRTKTREQAEKLRAMREQSALFKASDSQITDVQDFRAPDNRSVREDSVVTEMPSDPQALESELKKEKERRRTAEKELSKLQTAVSRLDNELSNKRRALSDAQEKAQALNELVQKGYSVGGQPAAPKAAAQASDDVSRMAAALERMEQELHSTRKRYRDAKEKLEAMSEVMRSQAGPAAAPKRQKAPKDDGQVGKLQAALGMQEQKLANTRAELSRAKETINALKELVERTGATAANPASKKTMAAGMVGPAAKPSDDVARLQSAVSLLETKLRRAEAAEADAKEKMRALTELAGAAGTGGANTKESKRDAQARKRAEQEVTQLQKAVSHLEQSLGSKQAELSSARERIAALEELVRQESKS